MLILAITAHYADSEFKLYEELLDFFHIPDRHTGRNLAVRLHKILHEYNIHTKLYCITTDNASNNGKMIKILRKLLRKEDGIEWDGPRHHVPCFAHVINLAVQSFLKNLKVASLSVEHNWINTSVDEESGGEESDNSSNDDIDIEGREGFLSNEESYDIPIEVNFASTLAKLWAIPKAANFPQNRILAFEQFCYINELKPLRPIGDHAIRWSATFNMLRRAIYLRLAIDQWT